MMGRWAVVVRVVLVVLVVGTLSAGFAWVDSRAPNGDKPMAAPAAEPTGEEGRPAFDSDPEQRRLSIHFSYVKPTQRTRL
ncbi:hypothetical protein [Halioxenophilus sp. WMMB6]|uniref:hypothetical protein n=1 Tax=Halioxenophilus sp. WMMB6 TaxID=3073815 RepID=UPI00295F1999|nr:hypothetical protein [Halioxenophilus sp. WMMB6]